MGLSLDIGCEAHKHPGALGVNRRRLLERMHRKGHRA